MIIRRNKQNNVQRVKLSELEDFELKFFLLSGRLFVSVLELFKVVLYDQIFTPSFLRCITYNSMEE